MSGEVVWKVYLVVLRSKDAMLSNESGYMTFYNEKTRTK